MSVGSADALYKTVTWKAPKSLDFLRVAPSFDNQSFKYSLITTRFSNATPVGSRQFIVAVGHPSDNTYGKGVFGAVFEVPPAGSEDPTFDDITFLDPGVSPSRSYSTCVNGATIVVFGGVSASLKIGDGASDITAAPKVWIFGVWESGGCPVRPETANGIMLKTHGNFEYGWFEMPLPPGGRLPPPRSLCSLFAFGDGSIYIHGGVGGVGHQTKEDVETALKESNNQVLIDARSTVETAHRFITAETDPRRIAGAVHLIFASAVVMTADMIDSLRGNAGRLPHDYIEIVENTLATSQTGRTQSSIAHIQLAETYSATTALIQYVKEAPSAETFDAIIKSRRFAANARRHAQKLIAELEVSLKLDNDQGVEFANVMAAAAPAALVIATEVSSLASFETYGDAWVVSLETPWTQMPASEITPRYSARCVVSNDGKKGYAFGGVVLGSTDPIPEVWCLENLKWRLVFKATSGDYPLLTLRHSAICVAPDDTIIVHGGFSSQCATPSVVLPAEMSPVRYLETDYGVDCPDGAKDRVVSDNIWAFDPKTSTWLVVNPLADFDTPKVSDAFHSLFVISSDDVSGNFTLGVAGGVNIVKNVYITRQKGIEDYAMSNEYPLSEISFEKAASTASRVYTRVLNSVSFIDNTWRWVLVVTLVVFIVVWVLVSIVSSASFFTTSLF